LFILLDDLQSIWRVTSVLTVVESASDKGGRCTHGVEVQSGDRWLSLFRPEAAASHRQ